ncbi:hypothetical protein F5Y05DRAFT_421688 [Hypoxylon sp. FL0543]|nr:hypothetical protein F5Y05DRAFT_421688 [Hypoxylon sp. FL0543]
MDPDQPIKAEGSAPEAPSVNPKTLDNASKLLSVPGAESSEAFQNPATVQSDSPSAPLPTAGQVGTEATTFPEAAIRAEPETMADQQHDSHEGDQRSMKPTDNLERLVAENVPEVLESAVKIGVDLLNQLNATLVAYNVLDVEAFCKSIDQLKLQAKPFRTVVGVVGNTGAGKSSVINALLDEERLLPTNCLRACTASPTEVSYNDSDDPTELYRAEVEFITADEWLKELEVLFSDLLDGSGKVSRDCANADSEAGIAYAKLKAVYPLKTREMIAQGTPEKFAAESSVKEVLGTVKTLKAVSAKRLYTELQHYVDSKEKITGHDHRKRKTSMEYWPLIKVVRIYTKADALSTGAVIVDLPGVQDSNAARAAVAENYMKSCTGLWIMAPITRAVNDKTAKSLLGDSFKRQLKYDGTYSAVSFICSKTDDISITEAVDSLGLEDELSELWERAGGLETAMKASQSLLAEYKKRKKTLGDQLDPLKARRDLWDELLKEIGFGKTVYAPPDPSKKRKRPQKGFRNRKIRSDRSSHERNSDDDYQESGYSSSEEDPQFTEDEQPLPLTKQEIEAKLASITDQLKPMREEKRTLKTQIESVREEIEEMETEHQEILTEIKARCIQGRNDYSRGEIKQDFAMGIKELDQENAVEENDTTFDPDQDLRDYEEVARTLHVFCVSSRAYQQLRGRLQKDDFQGQGFTSLDDTEIPQLQQHAKKLTEAGRASNCRKFLNELTQLINSMKLWVSSDGTQDTLTDVEKFHEETHLRKLLNDMKKGFETAIKEAVDLLEQSLEDNVYSVLDSSIPLAINEAMATAQGWGAPKAMGGMMWTTYKATVRREGVFTGASGPHDFNRELFAPIGRNLATGWDRVFQRRLPAILYGYVVKAKKHLDEFRDAAQDRARERSTKVSGMGTLISQLVAHVRSMEQLQVTLRATINNLQRDASREFTPAICRAMRPAYQVCQDEHGLGSFNRMKAAMAGHVENSRLTMFRDAADTVKTHLQAMCRTVEARLIAETEEMLNAIFRDYMKVLVHSHMEISPEELEMRASLNNLLGLSDFMFARALEGPAVGEPQITNGAASAASAATVDTSSEEGQQDGIQGEAAFVKREASVESQRHDPMRYVGNASIAAMVDAEEWM